jgi:hypothetical protein
MAGQQLEEAFMADLFRDIDATLWSSQPSPQRSQGKIASSPQSAAKASKVPSSSFKTRPLAPRSPNTPRPKHIDALKLPSSSYPTPPQSTKRKLQQDQPSSDDIGALVEGVDFGDGSFDDLERPCLSPEPVEAANDRYLRCQVLSVTEDSAEGKPRKVSVFFFVDTATYTVVC